MPDIEKKIGGKVTELRLEKKMTQVELAEKVGISVESISRLERGVSFPSLKRIYEISLVLNIEMKAFFDFDKHEAQDKTFERELSKFISFLRTLDEKQVNQIHKISKAAVKILGE